MSDRVVRRRFLWSLFIQNTENWLGRMSMSGLHLCGIDTHSRFIFVTGEPVKYKYCFSYSKFENSSEIKQTKASGWENVARFDKWNVYRTTNADNKQAMPNRRGIYLRNNSLLCLYALVSSIVLLLLFGMTFGYFLLYLHPTTDEIFFRRAVVIIGIFALLLLCNFILFLFMTAANSLVLEEPTDAIVPEIAYRQFLARKTFEKWLEKLLIRDGDIIKRIRPLWIMTPRSLEKWLVKMEMQGLNLYKVHNNGMMFYFIKNAPRKVKYCVISNNSGKIARCIADGWQVVYSTSGKGDNFGRLVIISHDYTDGTEPSPFDNEKEYVVNAAHISFRFIVIYFCFLLAAVTGLVASAYFKANTAVVWIVGIFTAGMAVLIIKMLLYLTGSMIAAKRIK